MEILIHAHGEQLAEDFREIVNEKLKTLARFSLKIDGIKVEVNHEPNPHHGKSSHEVTLATTGAGPFFRSEGKGFNDVAAFDEAVKSLEQQIRKLHEKKIDVNHHSIKNMKVNL